MEFNTYQKAARSTAIYPGTVSYPALGLAGETGEVCEKIKKCLRDKGGKIDSEQRQAIAKELGDVLWYVANLAKDLQLDLDYIAQLNLTKLQTRKEKNLLHGSGDDREEGEL